jgi:CO/xanthine dehydrogenase FAD-binding subunit
MAERGTHARILAGGTDILVQLRANRYRIERLVDVKQIPELNAVTVDSEGLTIGAAVPCHRLYEDLRISRLYSGLVDAASLVGGIQIQSRASIGGNLCNASPSADTIPIQIAYGGVASVVGPAGARTVPVERFCTAPGQTVLKEGELLVSIRFTKPQPGTGGAYLRFIPRNEMDIAVAGSAAVVVIEEGRFQRARLAIASVAPTPVFCEAASQWLVGQPVNERTIHRASELCQEAARPITDMRGSAAQRVHLVGVLARRALGTAVSRAEAAPGGA